MGKGLSRAGQGAARGWEMSRAVRISMHARSKTHIYLGVYNRSAELLQSSK